MTDPDRDHPAEPTTLVASQQQPDGIIPPETFLEWQYESLRKEIETGLERSFRLVIGGATIVPALHIILRTYSPGPIALALPFIIPILVLLYLAQMNQVMRCGRYIKEQIEPHVGGGIKGWETWLEDRPLHELGEKESDPDRRKVDNYIFTAFGIISFVYYLISVFIAVSYLPTWSGPFWVAIALYSVIGLFLLWLILDRRTEVITTQHESGIPRRLRLRRKLH